MDEANPIIIADRDQKDYIFIIMCELQHKEYVILHATNTYMGKVDGIVRLLKVFMKETEERCRIKDINTRTNNEIMVNRVVLELKDLLKQ